MQESGTLYIVGTPIGNLEDITLRAVRILTGSEVLVCEDTRVTSRLLEYLVKLEWNQNQGASKPLLVRLDEHTQMRMIPKVVNWLATGTSVALVTDAGMPAISDPGWKVVDATLKHGYQVEVVPGPTALAAAVAISGMDSARMWFVGFLPKKDKKRIEIFQEISRQLDAGVSTTVVFYESPHRLRETLKEIEAYAGNYQIAACGELTKVHEKVVRGPVAEVLERLPAEIRGEWVVVVGN